MRWTTVNFGKYKDKGKTLPQIVFDDPDWFFWACEKTAFHGALAAEAQVVKERATRIRVPQEEGERLEAEYVIHRPTGKFAGLELVEASRPPHVGSSPTFRSQWIDLSVPRGIAGYDKTGGKLLVMNLKHILFGSSKTKLTRKRCEEFFDRDANFVLDA